MKAFHIHIEVHKTLKKTYKNMLLEAPISIWLRPIINIVPGN